ncbi:Ubiquitin-specific protease family C19-related protein [Perilla frutescens var. hirtella]|uniref:Ubiquitin-specific protease family C19-related protein n=1 Tax=Perilla frutescens var. hirtella TaxID=608512 RepID=A0AAD4J4V9_PERFH|nr:Ubiquitin-specific protease family C19-related protein [Perilla frutescens var. hirtella]
MSARSGSHQLSNGLMVSGRPEQQLKERQPTMGSRAVPYTGGDVKKSGELGRMYGVDLSTGDHHHHPPPAVPPKLPSRQPSSSQHNSGSARSGPNSGQMGKNSGPMSKKSSSSSFSGPMTPIQPTGLITSGPLGSSSSNRRSGQLDTPSAPTSFNKAVYGSAVTSLNGEVKLGFRVSRVAMWMFLVVVVMGLVVGVFLMAAVKKPLILVAVAAVLIPVVVIFVWNYAYRNRGVLGFLKKFPDAELRGAVDGQFVKVTGVVTCGSIPLETSFQRVPRCVYAASELYEYRGFGGKPANNKQRWFSWGCRYSEKYVADFYISDFQSGLRALVKAGYGAKVAPFIKPTVVVDITKDSKKLSPNFLRWLSDRSLSSDDRVMRLKEGYIKEGSTVSVMGVVRRHENVLMIVPPSEPISTGCRWPCCLLPTYIEGLILTCDESQGADVVIPV